MKNSKKSDSSIKLVEGKFSQTLGDWGGKYWHIFYKNRRVGRVYISLQPDEDDDISLRPYITVEINKDSQGVGIGTIVFRMAATESGFEVVFGETRKNNMASQIAMSRAGYIEDRNYPGRQLRFIWKRE